MNNVHASCPSVQREVSAAEARDALSRSDEMAAGARRAPHARGMQAQPRVIDCMKVSVHSVDADTPLVVLDSLFELHDCSTWVVEEDGVRAGVVSRTDLFRVGRAERSRTLEVPERCVGEIMSREIVGLSAYELLSKAARLMADNALHQVFAIDDDKIGGPLAS